MADRPASKPLPEGAIIASPLFAAHGLIGWFTTRLGEPDSPRRFAFDFNPAPENPRWRARLASLRAAGLPALPHQARQTHGTGALQCAGEGRLHDAAADILFTSQAGASVAVRTADCLPVLLADPEAGVVCAAHAGWRGIVASVAPEAVARMRALGASPPRIIASLGPRIGPCCFEVGAECAERLAAAHPSAPDALERLADGRARADLAKLARLQLIGAGLSPAHVEEIDACTACDPRRFHSHRRDKGETGRHLAIAALPSPSAAARA